MLNEIQIALSGINLSAYSRSHGFIGFFGQKSFHTWNSAVTASNICMMHLGAELRNASILSSTHVELEAMSENGRASQEQTSAIRHLIDKNILPCINYADFDFDYTSVRYQKKVGEAWNNFRTLQINAFTDDDLAHFFAAKMSVFGVFGHCFLYLKERDLLIYPHDDFGFGFIATKNSSDITFGQETLKNIGNNSHRFYVKLE